jgi:NhaA family Na+:H+ antiporter
MNIFSVLTMILSIFKDFFQSEKSGGILLILCTCLSLIISNSAFGEGYIALWNFSLGEMSVVGWINDGLMTIFFLLIGLELEREIFIGELAKIRNAALPIAAAVGGMIVPAFLFYMFNPNTVYQRGFGIPMATDIAFSLTILSLFSSRVPFGLKIFLTALAIADDMGAILVIAVFYSSNISLGYLALSAMLFFLMYFMGKRKVYMIWPYLIGGVLMWYCTHHSGIHATISGVLLAFAIPFGDPENGPSHRLQSILHTPVAFIILPLFALANTCISISGMTLEDLNNTSVFGTMAGLVLGKPIGIFFFTFVCVKYFGLELPSEVNYKHILGAGLVAGIGFTMSIFITELAFSDVLLIKQIKLTILIGALVSSLLGIIWFKFFVKSNTYNLT